MKMPVDADALKEHSPVFWLITLALALITVALIALPILRSRELRDIELVVTQSSNLLVDALQNPSIFTGEPAEAREKLDADAKQMSQLHDKLVLAHYYFANSALESAIAYTDYTERIGNKLLQVGEAEQASLTAVVTYDQSVSQLKLSSLASRAAMQVQVNEMTPKVRDATDLAYQECQLLSTLTSQFGIHQNMALQHLSSLGPDVLATVGSLKPALTAATEKTLVVRNRFNPAVHS